MLELFSLNISTPPFYMALLAFVPGLINLGLFIYSFYFFSKTKLSSIFSLITFTACLWQFGEGFLRVITDIELSGRIYELINSSSLILTPSCLYFALLLTNKVNSYNKYTILTLIYAPSIFFMIAHTLGWITIKMEFSALYGYINITNSVIPQPLFSLSSLFISIIGILTVYFLIKGLIVEKNKIAKNRLSLITIGFLIPFIQGLITEIIFPELLNLNPVPLTTASITCFSVASIIALKRYNLFDFSPYKVSDSIINLMSDAVLISDNNGIIKYVNPSLAKMLKYNTDELIGKHGYFMLADNRSIEKVSTMIEERKKGKTNSYEVNMKTKDDNVLNMIINAAPYYINNQVMGAVAVIHDVTDEKKKVNKIKEAMIIGEEKERLRLSKELHDGIAQNIAVIKMNLQAIETKELSSDDKIIFNDITKITKDTLKEIRDISHNLHPLKEGELLCDAVKRLIDINKHNPIKFEFNVIGNKQETPISNLITTNLFRVLQEFINNTIKYAEASLITIDLNYAKNHIEIAIQDNGKGFDLVNRDIRDGIGILNMQQRIKVLDGTFEYTSEKNQGTRLKTIVPFNL